MITPSSLKFIKLKDYQKYCLIENPSNDDLLKCLLSKSDYELSKIKSIEVDKITEGLKEIFDIEHKFVPEFSIYGTTYGFIPKLDDITYGENKDITSYINDWGNMHKAMAVMFRPIKKKFGSQYIIEDYEGSHVYSEVMKDMPLNVVMGAMVFFYNLTNELLNYIPNYLKEQLESLPQHKVDSIKNGELTANYTALVKEALQNLKKLQSFPYINA